MWRIPFYGHEPEIPGSKVILGLPRWLSGKESACQSKRQGFDPWVGKISWRREWQPTPVVFPGKSHGQEQPGRLYSTWHGKESETNKWLRNNSRTAELPSKQFTEAFPTAPSNKETQDYCDGQQAHMCVERGGGATAITKVHSCFV